MGTVVITNESANKRCKYLLQEICKYTGKSEEEILTTRHYPDAGWRYAIIYSLRSSGVTLYDIGNAVGKTHSTIIFNYRQFSNALSLKNSPFSKIWDVVSVIDSDYSYSPPIYTSPEKIKSWLESKSIDEETIQKLMDSLSELSSIT